jgi:RND family efflux transporter MFP subunit
MIGASIACEHDGGRGHEHPHPHSDGEHGSEPAAQEEPPSLAITRWTDDYELFVELPVPTPGVAIPYHAHVTRLADFGAVTEGTFRVRFKTANSIATEATQQGVKRPGIFVFEAPAPSAGSYQLEMSYEHAGNVDVFDCGTVEVAASPKPQPEEPASTLTFLKETQWRIPFATAWLAEQPVANELEVAATVEPAAASQLTVGAPTGGRFFHSSKRALAEGLAIAKGEVLGTIAPNVAGDDYNRLRLAVEEARLQKGQLEREITRVQPLVEEKLLPQRRLIELQNELETASARLASASARLGSVTAPGGSGGLVIKSTLSGLISQVLVPNGEPVEPGAPLLRIGGTEQLWLRARFVAKPAASLVNAQPTSVRLQSGTEITLDTSSARLLSSAPVVDPNSRIATWIVEMARSNETAATPERQELRAGASVVVTLRFGIPENVLAVPSEAVVEINTRPYVFVQVDGEHFEKRAVTLGREDAPWVQVLSGLKQGERVVTRGGYDIHLASLMGSVESHRH